METQHAILSRRTANKWTTTPVPDAVITAGLEAAHMAPCHRLTWPWRFTIPGPETREALFELGVALKAAKGGLEVTPSLKQRLEEKLRNPALVVVSQIKDSDPMRFEEDYGACACAIQNLCLSVFEQGFHSKWSTGGLTRHEQTYSLLNINSEIERIIGFVWIGIPTREPNTPPRPDIEQFIRRMS